MICTREGCGRPATTTLCERHRREHNERSRKSYYRKRGLDVPAEVEDQRCGKCGLPGHKVTKCTSDLPLCPSCGGYRVRRDRKGGVVRCLECGWARYVPTNLGERSEAPAVAETGPFMKGRNNGAR